MNVSNTAVPSICIRLICDKNYPYEPSIEFTCDGGKTPKCIVNFNHEKCCAVYSIEGFWKFADDYYFVFAALLVVAGLILTFYGSNIIKYVVLLAAAVLSNLFLGTFFYTYIIPTPTEEWMHWLALGGMTATGIGLGYLLIGTMKAAIFMIGALGGVVPGLMLYQAVIYMVNTESPVFF